MPATTRAMRRGVCLLEFALIDKDAKNQQVVAHVVAQASGGCNLRVKAREAVKLLLHALLEFLRVLALIEGAPVSADRANEQRVAHDAKRDENQRGSQDGAAIIDVTYVHHDEEKHPYQQRL